MKATALTKAEIENNLRLALAQEHLMIVPIEPTEQMVRAGCAALDDAKDELMAAYLSGKKHEVSHVKMRLRWKAMLSAVGGQ